jgi:uncharacterized glyoxalase superfamily protein PhnB
VTNEEMHMLSLSHQSQCKTNRSMPPGTIIPELVYPDLAAAVAWLCAMFGFRERLRIGNHRSQLVLGAEAAIVAVQATQPSVEAVHGAQTHALMVRVDDLDRHYAHVVQSGARIVSPPADYPYGERQYTVEVWLAAAGHFRSRLPMSIRHPGAVCCARIPESLRRLSKSDSI